jgi:polysaccharide biosynthesis protein PslH
LESPTKQNCKRPDLLYVVHRVPYPPDKGDRIRAFQILRYLSQKASVHLACLADEPVEPACLDVLRRYCARVAVFTLGSWRWIRACGSVASGRTVSEGAFSSPQLRALLRQWAAETSFQGCLASASSMVPYLQMPELRNVPAVVDLVDVDSQKWLDYAQASRGPRAWLYHLEGRRLRRLERDLPNWARAVTLVSDAEADLYKRFAAPDCVSVIGNGVDLDYFRPRPGAEDQDGCVFLGALDYRPNVDGLVWFCNEVWPRVRRQRPDAKLHLVGRRPAPAVQRLAQLPGVALVGQVPDVRPFLARAAVSVVPLQIARGVQNKILEAMAMAKATVISPACMSGIQVEDGKNVLIASTVEQWTEAVVGLLQSPNLRRQLGMAAREHVVEEHRWERCLTPLDAIFGLSTTSSFLPAPYYDKSEPDAKGFDHDVRDACIASGEKKLSGFQQSCE